MSSDNYVNSAIINLETEMDKIHSSMSKKAESPLSSRYRPVIDISRKSTPRQINFYQDLISTLRWIYKLGRIDILMPVCLLPSYLMAPRVGYLDQAIHRFAYLKKYNRSKMVFGGTYLSFDASIFFKHGDWLSFHPEVEEPIPANAPVARGNLFITSYLVDDNHVG